MAQTARPTESSSTGAALGRLASGLTGGALAALGLSRRGPSTIPLALLGGVLVYRGAVGRWPLGRLIGGAAEETPATFTRAITIGREPGEIYAFWRDFSNLPRFMRHLEEVRVLDGRRSHWVAKAPLGAKVEWDAEITEEHEGRLISWRSLPGSPVFNAGTVRFQPAPGGRGAEVIVELGYNPPMGAAGRLVARAAGEEPEQQVTDDLRHLKMMLEAGEIATSVMRAEDKKEPR
jgi:uncharacterized membrane protein